MINIKATKETLDLSSHRGIITFNLNLLLKQPTEGFFKVIYSEFFPIGIQTYSDVNFYDKARMYGYSKHFRKIMEGEKIPEYELVLSIENDELKFSKMVELYS